MTTQPTPKNPPAPQVLDPQLAVTLLIVQGEIARAQVDAVSPHIVQPALRDVSPFGR